jgi:hypothetical protein
LRIASVTTMSPEEVVRYGAIEGRPGFGASHRVTGELEDRLAHNVGPRFEEATNGKSGWRTGRD